MKSKDQQMLEEAYSDVVNKMTTGSNNPGWKLKQGLTSGSAFKPWEPAGGWPKKKSSTSKPAASGKATQSQEPDDEFDVEGDPVGSLRYVPEPHAEEDHTASMMYVSNVDLEKVYRADESLFDRLFQGSEGAVEQDEGIVFRYLAPQIRHKMQQAVQSAIG